MKLWEVQEFKIVFLLFNESGVINLTWDTFKKILFENNINSNTQDVFFILY